MLENKNNQSTTSDKQYFLPTGKGGHIEVTEAVYHAYWDPERREEKRKQREWRCRDGKGARCNKDCTQCDFYRFKDGPNGSPLSSDALFEDTEFEIGGTLPGTDPERQTINNAFMADLDAFLNSLDDYERKLAEAVLYERPDKVVMAELGIEKQSTYSSRKIKMQKVMQDKFREYHEV